MRSCFHRLLDRMCSVWGLRPLVPNILMGTPGTGKSMFRFYVLYCLVQQLVNGEQSASMLTVAWEEPFADLTAPCDSSTAMLLQWSRETGTNRVLFSGHEFSSRGTLSVRVTNHPCFYIVDSMPPLKHRHAECRVLQVTSPRRDRWAQFHKQSNAVISYMPLWNCEDLVWLASLIRPT